MKKSSCFVPVEYRRALASVSKAHLADLAWTLAGRLPNGGLDHPEQVFTEIRAESDRVAIERLETSIGRWFDIQRRMSEADHG